MFLKEGILITGFCFLAGCMAWAPNRRIITAQALPSKCRITVELEDMRDGKYIKASFKAVKHTVLHDRLYSGMIMKEFNDKLTQEKHPRLYQAKTIRSE
jgi:hypothetical protein